MGMHGRQPILVRCLLCVSHSSGVVGLAIPWTPPVVGGFSCPEPCCGPLDYSNKRCPDIPPDQLYCQCRTQMLNQSTGTELPEIGPT
ncbi:hypothetical protein B0F90DRAFT_1727831 [Multifurca ochricompacta]|uniref:Secreted protein n=1 Tax=Multifurca ochricompacta TaxID=376703 RepID=A0AAD4M2R4_9AGAM|nr:hypothetical protein B0F90DRAFT_1727831 [Multifurca ochricompacta]